MDNTIHRINLYPLDSAIVLPPPNIYPLLDSDLSGGLGYPAYKQLGPGRHVCLQEAGFCCIMGKV